MVVVGIAFLVALMLCLRVPWLGAPLLAAGTTAYALTCLLLSVPSGSELPAYSHRVQLQIERKRFDDVVGVLVAVEPDVDRSVFAVQEEMPQRQLAHHRYSVRYLVPHGAGDSLS